MKIVPRRPRTRDESEAGTATEAEAVPRADRVRVPPVDPRVVEWTRERVASCPECGRLVLWRAYPREGVRLVDVGEDAQIVPALVALFGVGCLLRQGTGVRRHARHACCPEMEMGGEGRR